MDAAQTNKRRPQKLTARERVAEIKRLRELLRDGRFTLVEMASIRGRIGGLVGAEHPGRRLGGIRGAEARWKRRHRKAANVKTERKGDKSA